MIAQKFIDDLGTLNKAIRFEEDFFGCEFVYEFLNLTIPTEDAIGDLFNTIRQVDTCSIGFNIDDSDSIVVTQGQNISSVLGDLSVQLSGHEEGEKITVTIRINKSNADNNFHFYSADCWYKYIKGFTPLKILSFFSGNDFDHNSTINITIDCWNGFLKSSKFQISSPNHLRDLINFDYRGKRFNSITSNTHSTYFGKLKVLPEDFNFLLNGSSFDEETLNFFKKISLILCISSIFDITDLTTDEFYFKLNGYKSISHSVSINDINIISLETYLNIYEWIYKSGSIVDKIGLARNIISLHLKKDSPLELEGDVFESLKSSYKIYEKQNIKQYIEVRNKMSDQILDYSKRALTITDNFASGFQKSALSLVTFFSSLIVTKVLAGTKDNADFVRYSTIITFVFIGVTLLYMLISIKELKGQEARFKKSYLDFKKRYTDLLTEEDIKRIVNNDEEHNSDLQFITDKKNWYTWLWVIVLGLIVIGTLIYYNWDKYSVLSTSMINYPDL